MRRWNIMWSAFAALIVLSSLPMSAAAQGTAPTKGATPPATGAPAQGGTSLPASEPDASYVIGVGDTVAIEMPDRPDFKAEPKVDAEGNILTTISWSLQMGYAISNTVRHSLERFAGDLRPGDRSVDVYVSKLRGKLEAAMPGAVIVDRRREGMFGPKRVRRIAVDAGGQRLELRTDGSSIQTRSARLSGGIVLKNEDLGTDEWLQALGAALADQARNSLTTRQALDRLLNG